MPEGPEIKQSADKIAAALEGKPLKAVAFVWPALTSWEKELAQHQIVKVEARSKAMLLHWSNQMTLYSHNQLYGVWYVRKNGDTPKTNRALRLSITGPQKTAWLYSATDIALLDPDELAEHPYLLRLGPDVLHPQTDLERVLQQYQDPRFRRRSLSSLLLDQGFLAGLGNYLRSEILFVAGVPFYYRPADCSAEQLQKLAEASLAVPRQSYATGGITLAMERANALKTKGAQRHQYRFYVFAKEGKPCVVCQTPILRVEAGGRRIYYCPRCQPDDRAVRTD
jgi:endonuclease VIII